MAVPIETNPTFQAGRPQRLFSGPYLEANGVQYDVTPDGRRFLMLKRHEDVQPQLTVVLDWTQELLERVPVP